MRKMPRQTTVTAIGGVGVAFLSALCCAGPIIAVSLGLSGAGLDATFEPLRPYFLGGSATFLAFGFFVVHREEKAACEPVQALRGRNRPASHEAGGMGCNDRGGAVCHLPVLAEPSLLKDLSKELRPCPVGK